MKQSLKNILLLLLIIQNTIYSYEIVPIDTVLKLHPEIIYNKCFDEIPYNFKPFPLNPEFPNTGNYQKTFVLEIPNGTAQGIAGFSFIDNKLIKETTRTAPHCLFFYQNIHQTDYNLLSKVSGRVAVTSQIFCGNYYHALFDNLGRLALIEMNNIDYNFIYIPFNTSFIKELIAIWGIKPEKIIPSTHVYGIEADTLLVPSELCNTLPEGVDNSAHLHPYTTIYLREKLLQNLKKFNIDISKFSKKIFISRKDAGQRKIINEDDIFKPLQEQGFVRYEMSKLSVAEQIILFHNADIIIAEHGAALANIIFCKPGTKLIEIVHHLPNDCFWWLSQIFNLDHTIIPLIHVGLLKNGRSKNPHHDWHQSIFISQNKINEIVNTIL